MNEKEFFEMHKCQYDSSVTPEDIKKTMSEGILSNVKWERRKKARGKRVGKQKAKALIFPVVLDTGKMWSKDWTEHALPMEIDNANPR